MSLKLTDRVAVQEEGSGGAIHYVPITEFNTLISSEESGRLDDLETAVGTYEGDNDLSTDVADILDNVSELQDLAQTAGSGEPETPVAAEAITGEGENWEITWTAETAGEDGNNLTITIALGSGISQPIGVSLTGTDITVTLATDESGDPDDAVNTATAVKDAVNGDAVAGLLVQGDLTGNGGVCAEQMQVMFEGGVDGTAGKAGELRYSDFGLHVSIGNSTAENSFWRTVPLFLPATTVIDLSEASADYQISGNSQTVVLVDNDDPVFDLLLPVATLGLRIIISNQDGESVDVAPDGTDTINGTNAAITLATTESATLICYATGKWAVV